MIKSIISVFVGIVLSSTTAFGYVTLSPLSGTPGSDKEGQLKVGTGSRTRLNPTTGDAADTTEVILAIRYGGVGVNLGEAHYVAMRFAGEFATYARGERGFPDHPNFAMTIIPLSKRDVDMKVGKGDINYLPVNISYDTMIGQKLAVTVDVIGASISIPLAQVGPLAFLIGANVHGLGYTSMHNVKGDTTYDEIHLAGGDLGLSIVAAFQSVKIKLTGGVAGDVALAQVADEWKTDVIFAKVATLSITLAQLTNWEFFFQFRSSKNPVAGGSFEDFAVWNNRVMAGIIYRF